MVAAKILGPNRDFPQKAIEALRILKRNIVDL